MPETTYLRLVRSEPEPEQAPNGTIRVWIAAVGIIGAATLSLWLVVLHPKEMIVLYCSMACALAALAAMSGRAEP